MYPSRSQRISRNNNSLTYTIRRWAIRILGLGVIVLCVYTAWDFLSEPSNQEVVNEQPVIDIESTHEQAVVPAAEQEVEQVANQQSALDIDLDPIVNPMVIAPEQVSLAFVGDIMMGGNVGKLLINKGYDYPYLYVSPILSGADIAAGNLENPITDRGEPVENKTYLFRTSPDAVPELAKSGLDLFNLANNHILDYGWTGLEDTIGALTKANLHSIGAGKDQVEAYEPVVIEKNGVRVAYIGLSRVVPEVSWKADKHSPGVAETYDYTRPIKAIEAANEISDMVVVMVHWGVEGALEPRAEEKKLAHRYIDAGADLVIGSHPHVLQGFESYKGKWIAYSLGNFIFTTNGKSRTNETAIVQANCSKSGDCQLNVIPLVAGPAQPQRMEDVAAKTLYEHITSISYSAEVQADGQVRVLDSSAIR